MVITIIVFNPKTQRILGAYFLNSGLDIKQHPESYFNRLQVNPLKWRNWNILGQRWHEAISQLVIKLIQIVFYRYKINIINMVVLLLDLFQLTIDFPNVISTGRTSQDSDKWFLHVKPWKKIYGWKKFWWIGNHRKKNFTITN